MSVHRSFPALIVLLVCCVATIARGQSIPEEARRQMGQLVTTWKCEVRLGDKVVNNEIMAKWTTNKDAVIWEWNGTDVITGKMATSAGIIGWDGHRKVLFEASVTSLGEMFTGTHQINPEGWESPIKGTQLVDGKLVPFTATRVFKWNSPDEMSIISKDRKIEDKPQPDITSIFRRVK